MIVRFVINFACSFNDMDSLTIKNIVIQKFISLPTIHLKCESSLTDLSTSLP